MHTGRDRFLVDIDEDRLKSRIGDYFDPRRSHEWIAERYPAAMRDSSAFKISDARMVRDMLVGRGGPDRSGFLRVTYRPFDDRWLYWEADRRLLTAPSPDYRAHLAPGNLWLSAARHLRKDAGEPQACMTTEMASFHLIERGAAMFPAWLHDDSIVNDADGRRSNLSVAAERYLDGVGASVEDLFHYVLVTLHDAGYRETNAGALQMGWPRIPLPGWPGGVAEGSSARFAAGAEQGRELAALLDGNAPVAGVTHGALRAEIAAVAVPATVDGANMSGEDFAVTAGWGHYGRGGAVMPGQGRVVERPYTEGERGVLAERLPALGETTYDVYLNGRSLWRNVPAPVWTYRLGGYQVLKKWLSYREHAIIDRGLDLQEVADFSNIARRIAAIVIWGRKTTL